MSVGSRESLRSPLTIGFAFGRANRSPGAPAAVIIAAADIRIPKQIVQTSADAPDRVEDRKAGVHLPTG